MTCKEFEQLIPDYLDHKLDSTQIEEFIIHARECEDCMEEMRIQYLVIEGMHRLEDGQSMDMDQELEERLQASMKTIWRRKMGCRILIGITGIALVVGIAVAFIVL